MNSLILGLILNMSGIGVWASEPDALRPDETEMYKSVGASGRELSGKYSGHLDVVPHERECKIGRVYAEVQIASAAKHRTVKSRNILDIVT